MLKEFPRFAWASGEECSDPVVLYAGKLVRVDQLETTGHLGRLEQDLFDIASLGIGIWRYGMPWRRTEIAPGHYDWSLWDRALGACTDAGLTPVVDLCHFGLPDHYRGFCDPLWVEGFVAYAEAFLARYSEPRFFTPVNEPAVTALNSAMTGIWNDRKTSLNDFARAFANCMLADLEVSARVRDDRNGWNVMAEGFQVFAVTDESQQAQADWMQTNWQATWDLRLGVDLNPVAEASLTGAVDERLLATISSLATKTNVIAGHDFYPLSVLPMGPVPDGGLSIAERVAHYEVAARRWYERYGIDFWISETSNLGLPVDQGIEWLETLLAAIQRMTGDGIPVRGICWYSRGDQHDWDSVLARPEQCVTEVGLFDNSRKQRPVAERFAKYARECRPN